MTLPRDIECPKRFNISPSMKSLLKRNVAMFAAGFRANSKQTYSQSQACLNGMPGGDVTPIASGAEVSVEKCKELKNPKDPNGVDMVLTKDLERQVNERKEWAHHKAMQAARKLSNDLTELKMLRMEREETQRLKKGK
ncbi:hypothetical protein Ddye_023321 [Dipteronia dyeriana]|uniref:Uncharacterized protein n=1 Tax=Dipteronia dyeriana TaxID=168575 RepID=A0AAD9TTQ9_9ROSI|nr:hypothetical protein Ddye_023321 [Dipteronia dyeriana]